MLNSINNSSLSFGAYASYLGAADTDCTRLDEVELAKVIESQYPRAEKLYGFGKFLQGEEGKAVLDRLPSEDEVVITTICPSNGDGIYQECLFSHKGKPVDGFKYILNPDSGKNLTSLCQGFSDWIDGCCAYAEKIETCKNILKGLITPYTTNENQDGDGN